MMTRHVAQCQTPSCRAWSYQVGMGHACPYCGLRGRYVRFWRIVNWMMVLGAVTAILVNLVRWAA